jgi:hypothetical protein
VISYIDALAAVDAAMRASIAPLEELADVIGLVRSHRISRSGEIGIYSYKVHGAGCLFTSENGTEIDVDFAADGTAVFDPSISDGCAAMGGVCLSLMTPLSRTCGPQWSR